MSKIPSNRLVWHRESRTWTAEISDLGPDFSFDRKPGNLAQVHVVSEGKGIDATFSLIHTEKDVEGDLLYWLFAPTIKAVETTPRLRGARLMIFND
jgi:hypothetical protein